MLAYDHDCPNCGVREVFQRHQEHDICPDCDSKVRVIVAAVPTHGIVFSNAETSNQLGVTWNTNKEKRDWMKAHPSAVPFEKGSQTDLNMKSSLRDQAEKSVQKMGFKDKHQFTTEKKAQRRSAMGQYESKIVSGA